jgi:hypothetical protein
MLGVEPDCLTLRRSGIPMDTPATVIEKIRSEELRTKAMAGDSRPSIVIVELDLPQPKIEAISPSERTSIGRPSFRFSQTADESADITHRVAQSSSDIERIIGKPPERFLATSGTFIVEANGEQIRNIAKLPTVSAIWPNTKR